jgi:hypothetical protein
MKHAEITELNSTKGELITVRFGLESEPIMYQLQVHRDNYNLTCGDGAFDMAVFNQSKRTLAVKQMIHYYGQETVNYFLTEHLGVSSVGVARRSGAGVRKSRKSV